MDQSSIALEIEDVSASLDELAQALEDGRLSEVIILRNGIATTKLLPLDKMPNANAALDPLRD